MTSQTDFSSFREGAERLDRAMRGVPDRVPVCAQMHEFAMKEIGAKPVDFYSTPGMLVNATLEIQDKYGIDVPVLDYDVYNIEAEAIGQAIIFGEDHMPDVDRTNPLIRDHKDLDRIQTPDFNTQGRFAQVIEMNRLFRKAIGGQTEITLRFCAPFSLAANLRGIEQLIMDIYTDPDFAHSLLDRVVENLLAPWIMYLKKEFPKATGISGDDATSSLPIVNPDILREWIVPRVLRLREICGPEIYVPNWVGEHNLKDPKEMLDLKRQVCPGFVEGQDPDVEKLGPELYKDFADAHDVPLILGVGAGFLALASPEQVAQRVRHYVEVGGKGGRLVLYLCNLGATTPPENVRAAIQAVREFGVYS
jgi:uroporphyrinogen decarboxylase